MTDEARRQRSIEYGGLGQSGYTSGRAHRDRALELEIETRNPTYPRGVDEDELQHELGIDDRFTGRGGPLAEPSVEDELAG